MRIMLKNQTVLAGAGLALVAVTQYILGLGRLLRNERPRHPGRKPRTPAPAQPRILHFIDDGVRLHGKRLLDSLVAVEFEVAIDVRRTHAKAPGDDLYLIGMGDQISHEDSLTPNFVIE